MEKQTFKILIEAPKEKVWDILWSNDTYPLWTAPFGEGSSAETDWKEGSKALFLSAANEGMVSRIAKNIPYEFMSINHIGMIKNGVEDLSSPDVKEWAGCFENYTLTQENGHTNLIVEMDIIKKYQDYFVKIWPIALEKVKDLSENK